jgi:hypothetical protein
MNANGGGADPADRCAWSYQVGGTDRWPRVRLANPMPSLPPGGEPMVARARRIRMVGVRTGRRGWRSRRGAECDFRARTLCNGERAGGTGMVGVRTGRRGWRLWRGAECDFRARTLCNGERAGGAGIVRGPERTARLAVAAGRGMRFSRKDPMQRGAGRRDRDGRGPDRTARLAVAAGRGMRFSRNKPMQSLPPGYDPLVETADGMARRWARCRGDQPLPPPWSASRPKPSRGGGEEWKNG